MTRDDIVTELHSRNMDEIIELIEDAENGELEELELAKPLGLLREEQLNDHVIKLLEENGVKIIYVEE
ncbi:hypothetical protein J2S74_002622 [Evansella vedderi]|uniref:Uncharacterized protein n=2 Tax=Evansella vedderi TaxID=38282 RepID=A0ABT9ZVH4_9BACI|nr:hypothetical protein [Evansella vedderi]